MAEGSVQVLSESIVRENVTENKFVKFSYRAEDALLRKKAVKQAHEEIEKAVTATGGDMTRELVDLYERLNDIMIRIADREADIVRTGR